MGVMDLFSRTQKKPAESERERAAVAAPAAAPPQEARPSAPADLSELEAKAVDALQTCFDPEIPVNIYELGLIYEVKAEPPGVVTIRMTLTSPNCPSAAELPLEVESKVRAIPGVTDAVVQVVFDPPWEPSRMTEAARLQLGMW